MIEDGPDDGGRRRLLTNLGVLVVVRVPGGLPQDQEAGRGQVLQVAERLFV
jgi:hypothetical protein